MTADKKLPKVKGTSITENKGLNLIDKTVTNDLGWLFREQPTDVSRANFGNGNFPQLVIGTEVPTLVHCPARMHLFAQIFEMGADGSILYAQRSENDGTIWIFFSALSLGAHLLTLAHAEERIAVMVRPALTRSASCSP